MTGLIPPKLDDRSYEELRNELIRRIPVHSREWTDHNASDPGITLLDLFAWLGENLLYRMNRVPEKSKLEFLRLLNLPPRPAAIARTWVRISLPRGTERPEIIEYGGLHPRATMSAGGGIDFQVLDEVTVLPVEIQPYVKRPWVGDSKPVGQEEVQQFLQDHLNQAQESKPNITAYETVPLPALEDGILPPATALGDTLDRDLWIAVLAPEASFKGLATEIERRKKRETLRLALAGHVISLGLRLDDELCGSADHMQCPPPAGSGPRYPIQWQIATGRFLNKKKPRVDEILYQRLRVHSDGTDGLARSGIVRLQLPEAKGEEPGFGNWTGDQFGPDGADLLGVMDLPPRLDDVNRQTRVLTWIRCFRPEPTDGAAAFPDPQVRFIDGNMVEVEHAVTAPGELLGYGNGRAGQVLQLSHFPLIPDSVVLQVLETAGWVNWQRVDDLAVACPNDPFYELDATTGEVRFGDGINGRIPLPGEMVRCPTYRYGGGAQGNVPASAINRINAPNARVSFEVTNPLAAAGGRDVETEAEAVRRIPQALRHRNRAVAAEDFRDLALATPGVHVGRVEVLPRHKPQERVDGVPGVVTLVVLPAYDPLHPDEPTPDREMQRRVCEHLEPRRLVTTELYVTPPEYVSVWVSVAIEVEPDYGLETVRRWVELAVRQYLAPVPPYGPDGKGWPFGRAVRRQDVEAAVLRVEGVRLANDVKVLGTEISPDGTCTEVSEVVRLARWQLPVMRNVLVTDEAQAEAIDRVTGLAAADVPGAAPPSTAVPVPVKLEEC